MSLNLSSKRPQSNQLYIRISNVTRRVSFYPCTDDCSLGYSHWVPCQMFDIQDGGMFL